PPNVLITSPSNGFTVNVGATVTYTGVAADVISGALPGSALSWADNGADIGVGGSVSRTYSAAGTHVVTLSAHNCSAISGTASVTVNVIASSGTPNTAQILSPANGSHFLVDSEDSGG